MWYRCAHPCHDHNGTGTTGRSACRLHVFGQYINSKHHHQQSQNLLNIPRAAREPFVAFRMRYELFPRGRPVGSELSIPSPSVPAKTRTKAHRSNDHTQQQCHRVPAVHRFHRLHKSQQQNQKHRENTPVIQRSHVANIDARAIPITCFY